MSWPYHLQGASAFKVFCLSARLDKPAIREGNPIHPIKPTYTTIVKDLLRMLDLLFQGPGSNRRGEVSVYGRGSLVAICTTCRETRLF
jgi:hypothetical protein